MPYHQNTEITLKMSGVTMVPQETRERQKQLKERGDDNKARFWQWARDNECMIFISYPRSGKQWMRFLLRSITGKKVNFPYGIDASNYGDFLYFNQHCIKGNDKIKSGNIKIMLLVRDPRDVALSRAYYATRWGWTKDTYLTTEIMDDFATTTSSRWREEIILSHNLNPLAVIQYEQLCLYPVESLNEALQCLGNPPRVMCIEDAISLHDRTKTLSVHNGEIAMEIQPQVFNDGLARYQRHCLKWQRDDMFTEKHADMIWEACGETMMQYGYTKEGHVHTNDFRRNS